MSRNTQICSKCGSQNVKVKRLVSKNSGYVTRRSKKCRNCGYPFRTVEFEETLFTDEEQITAYHLALAIRGKMRTIGPKPQERNNPSSFQSINKSNNMFSFTLSEKEYSWDSIRLLVENAKCNENFRVLLEEDPLKLTRFWLCIEELLEIYRHLRISGG